MISVSKARKLLGKDDAMLSNEQVEEILRECQVLMEIFWEQQTRKTAEVIDKKQQNTKMVSES